MSTAQSTPVDIPQDALRLLTVPEAHALTGITERALRHLIAIRAVPVVRIRRKVFFRARDLEAWLLEHTAPEQRGK